MAMTDSAFARRRAPDRRRDKPPRAGCLFGDGTHLLRVADAGDMAGQRLERSARHGVVEFGAGEIFRAAAC
jgi:hypothetical protein